MFKPTMIAAALAAVSAPAFAGGLTPAAPEPVVQAPVAVMPAPVASADWSGAYVGAQLGYGDFQGESDLGSEDDLTGQTYGVFAGYQQDLGRFVVGGELAYDDVSGIGSDTFGIDGDSLISAKVRLGYDAGRFLPYVTLGGAQLATTGAVDDSDTGYLYGLGADYALTDSWRIGVEANQYQFDDFADSGIDISGTNVDLRVSFAF